MSPRNKHNKIELLVEAVIAKTEIRALVNGKAYSYWIDGAFIPEFFQLYGYRPGLALNFLKKHSYHTEKRE